VRGGDCHANLGHIPERRVRGPGHRGDPHRNDGDELPGQPAQGFPGLIKLRGGDAEGAFLDESDEGPKHWTHSYFKPGAFKTRRREMFFTPAAEGWAKRAGRREQDETSSIGDTPSKAKKKTGGT
jgi:hypothetical protein